MMTTQQPALAMSADRAEHDAQFLAFLASMRRRFESIAGPLFTTAPKGLEVGLFERFLAFMPRDKRQHYTCNSCRRFMERFGTLVTIAESGAVHSAVWDPNEAPSSFRAIAAELQRTVQRWPITGVFASSEMTWGTPSNTCAKPPFTWTHMALTPPQALVFPQKLMQTAEQYVALKLEEHGMLERALDEFSIDVLRRTHLLFSSEQMFRGEKHASIVKWLLNVQEARNRCSRERARDNIIWSVVAAAPVGWCNVRSGLIGTVLEDVKAGLSIDVIKAKHAAKMHPLLYQRPQAPPAAGNVKQAEKLVSELDSAGALARRFARLDEIAPHALWLDRSHRTQRPSGPVFGHLKTKDMQRQSQVDADLPVITMTWVKFRDQVLSDALSIELEVLNGKAPFAAFVTAVNPDAPPILQWDEPDARNPVSWYLYSEGSLARHWNVVGQRAKVTAVCLQPTMWSGEDRYAHQGKAVFFMLEGCRDMMKTLGMGNRPGGGFFPECLRSEYHSVRATLGAYAESAHIVDIEGEHACGLKFQARPGPHDSRTVIRVTTKHGTVCYCLDRWD
jgi:hypothetical protein